LEHDVSFSSFACGKACLQVFCFYSLKDNPAVKIHVVVLSLWDKTHDQIELQTTILRT